MRITGAVFICSTAVGLSVGGCGSTPEMHPKGQDSSTNVTSVAIPPQVGDTILCAHARTTIAMRECASAELARSDRMLKALEDTLLANIDPGAATALRGATSQWQRYRTLECTVIDSVYSGGTMASIGVLGCRLELADTRRKYLQSVYSGQLLHARAQRSQSSKASQ
jgi:uncharacterized protein YecT (DUF1311 family)